MALTLISNLPLIVTPPLAQPSPYYNPAFLAIDPVNGNYFAASGDDLVTFYCSPVALSPAWSSSTTYVQGQVVFAGSPTTAYIATAQALWNSTTTYSTGQYVSFNSTVYVSLQNSNVGQVPGLSVTFWQLVTNLNLNPTSNPSIWSVYTGSTITVYSSPDACTGRKSDIINYPIPDGGHVQFNFQGSSFYTQPTGQINFLATSNLVIVLIQSI